LSAANTSSYPGSGSTFYDISGNGRDFIIYNSPTLETTGGVKGFTLLGTNQYAEAATMTRIPATNGYNFTICTVFKISGNYDFKNETKIVFSSGSFGNSGLGLTNTPAKLQWEWAVNDYNVNTGLVVPLDTWSFGALTISQTEVKVYLGSSVFTKSVNYPSGYFSSMNLWRQTGVNTRFLQGGFSSMLFYDRTLTPSEIAQNRAALGNL
jgi:hypothetical protein